MIPDVGGSAVRGRSVALPGARIYAVEDCGTDHGTQDGTKQCAARGAAKEGTGDSAKECTQKEAPAIAVRSIRHGHSLRCRCH
ncbi:hypothetical protein AAU01_36980 [Paenarthrobacter aurescens]|uniref:Uncharacterized protein n=1 Tax=Paenarthrobacter aurescens TaxID=43663 RepID=A0A4Y3NI96_PAEAU|nr:hypothetical protein AAU01_36980 [Paenarthrobacter aurescens]